MSKPGARITIPPLRLIFAEGFVPPGLPCSFAFAPFHSSGAHNGPSRFSLISKASCTTGPTSRQR